MKIRTKKKLASKDSSQGPFIKSYLKFASINEMKNGQQNDLFSELFLKLHWLFVGVGVCGLNLFIPKICGQKSESNMGMGTKLLSLVGKCRKDKLFLKLWLWKDKKTGDYSNKKVKKEKRKKQIEQSYWDFDVEDKQPSQKSERAWMRL